MHNFRNEIAENFMNSTEFNTQVTQTHWGTLQERRFKSLIVLYLSIHPSIYGSFYEICAFSLGKIEK